MYAGIFAAGYDNLDHFSGYVELLTEDGQLDKAILETDQLLQRKPSSTLELVKSSLLLKKREYGKAIELLKRLRQNQPFE